MSNVQYARNCQLNVQQDTSMTPTFLDYCACKIYA